MTISMIKLMVTVRRKQIQRSSIDIKFWNAADTQDGVTTLSRNGSIPFFIDTVEKTLDAQLYQRSLADVFRRTI